jgi:hypothetical protein
MIGVIPAVAQTEAVKEFFELFKTPWEFYQPDNSYDVILISAEQFPEVTARLVILFGTPTRNGDVQAGFIPGPILSSTVLDYQGNQVPLYGGGRLLNPGPECATCLQSERGPLGLRKEAREQITLRLGYDLFHEVALLLSQGQPVEHAHVPTLDLHIRMLRDWILGAGLALVEIPPVPAAKKFMVCLTHDIDFIGIRDHKFDHTLLGFLYRSTVGAVRDAIGRRIPFGRLLQIWKALASLPLVFLGWVRDFWVPFDWFLRVEKGLPATYYLIPFKNRAGQKVSLRNAKHRATKYDVQDIPEWTETLRREGCEIGVHGIDAWHSVELGRAELQRVAGGKAEARVGIRMHWLLNDANTYRVLEEAGYSYDSTSGYNETIGYRCGTTQVFRPCGTRDLLELPMHIQDGALFFPNRLGLCEDEAWRRCAALVENSHKFGGVLTLLWHDRSHGPERFWGGFYERLVNELKQLDVWFGSGAQVVEWFRLRRQATFRYERDEHGKGALQLVPAGNGNCPALSLKVYRPGPVGRADGGRAAEAAQTIPLEGREPINIDELLRREPVLSS